MINKLKQPKYFGLAGLSGLCISAFTIIWLGAANQNVPLALVIVLSIILLGVGAAGALLWFVMAMKKTLANAGSGRIATQRLEKRIDKIDNENKSISAHLQHTERLIKGLENKLKPASNQTKAAPIKRSAQVDSKQSPIPLEAPHNLSPSIIEIQTYRHDEKDRFNEINETRQIDKTLPTHEVLNISKTGFTLNEAVKPNEKFELSFEILRNESASHSTKAGVLWAKAYDEDNTIVDCKLLRHESQTFGSFEYLDNSAHNIKTAKFTVPARAHRIEYGICRWTEDLQLLNRYSVWKKGEKKEWMLKRKLSQLKVAVILDEFSFRSFQPEFEAFPVTPYNWQQVFEKANPDLFLCESAWSGKDSVKREWKGQVYASSNFNKENRTALLGILDYCKAQSIPTVFWNKEDPTHYDDKIHDFVDTAVKFDHVFTTDRRMVTRYKTEYGHESVHCLPFAVQPRLFNPIGDKHRSQQLVFAGGWYANHKDRCQAMKTIFDNAMASGIELKIYDRFFGTDDYEHQFPGKYRPFLNKPVAYSDIAGVYKESDFGLTINTVIDSPTMFARRIFELMACNTLVISNYSSGVYEFFGNNVIYLDRDPKALDKFDSSALSKIRRENLEQVLRFHTYEERFRAIVDVAGIAYDTSPEKTAIAVRINNLSEADSAFIFLHSYSEEFNARVLLLDSKMNKLDAMKAFKRANRNGVRVVDEALLLGSRIRIDEAFDFADRVLLLPADSVDDKPKYQELSLHLTYVDYPVSSSTSAKQYCFEKSKLSRPTIVKISAFKSVLEQISKNNEFLTYVV